MAAPKYSILLQPRGDDSGLNRLLVTVTLESPSRNSHESMFSLPHSNSSYFYPYGGTDVRASDYKGVLGITAASSDDSTEWKADRDTVGDVVLTLEAHTRILDDTAGPWICEELHRDQGGLMGAGSWFLPKATHCERFQFLISWDLSHAPQGTRASWSYGEGAETTAQVGPIDLLLGSVFMVGPIVSFEPLASTTGGDEGEATFVIHWFGQLPLFFQPLKDLNAKVYLYARAVFGDKYSCNKVYVRESRRGFDAHNFASCYMIQYSNSRPPRHESELIRYITHEMIHNWAFLGPEPDGRMNFWFIEGIADFYALYIPIRAGIKGVQYFCQTLDEFLTAYYTSSLINTPYRQIPSDGLGESVPYRRGFLYLLLVDARLRARTIEPKKCNPIDSPVLEVYHKGINGDRTDSIVWRETLRPLLGKEVVDADFDGMMNGTTLKPDDSFVWKISGETVRLKAVEEEVLDFGFSYRSFDTRIIEGMVPGSRAERAGLRNGDNLIANSLPGACRMNFEEKLSFAAKRGDVTIEGEYWPRSFTKVLSYRTEIVEH